MKRLITILILLFTVSNVYGYDRKEWKHWIDADKDCQDTRQEILIRDAIIITEYKTIKECRVTIGVWICPYSNEIFSNPSKLDIDHIISLKYADTHGGDKWSKAKKKKFANDYLNLLAVKAKDNRSKGAKGILEWKPTNKTFWKEYGIRWWLLMRKYDLNIPENEQEEIKKMIQGE